MIIDSNNDFEHKKRLFLKNLVLLEIPPKSFLECKRNGNVFHLTLRYPTDFYYSLFFWEVDLKLFYR